MRMMTVSAAELQRHFGRYQNEALMHPVAITRSREVLRAGDLTDVELDQIAKTEMDPRHHHLDRELQ